MRAIFYLWYYATRNPQRIKIEPLRFPFAYDSDAFCHCPLHFIRRIG